MSWKKLLESASKSVNDDLRLRSDYLVAENRILYGQIDGRVQWTDHERRELADIGAKLRPQSRPDRLAAPVLTRQSKTW